MRIRRMISAGLVVATIGALLASCNSPDDDREIIIKTVHCEPLSPLVPTDTDESCGLEVLDLLFDGLVSYELDGSPRNEVAESIKSDDNQNWTIKLKKGRTFSDGTLVKARNFVAAWNYGAAAKNVQGESYFFEPIKGYAEASAQGSKIDSLSGLKIVDDYTFTVELISPQSDFPLRLGAHGYSPLPGSAFTDMKAFGQHPIGNGPYKLDGRRAWEHDKHIKLVTNDKYRGSRKASNDGVTFLILNDPDDDPYRDLQAGRVDVFQTPQVEDLESFVNDFDLQLVFSPGPYFESLVISHSGEHFKQDGEGRLRRQALSMAIDRTASVEGEDKTLPYGSRTPATDFGSPTLPEYSKSLKGSEVLKYNPEEARKRWAQANRISDWGKASFNLVLDAEAGAQQRFLGTVLDRSIEKVLKIGVVVQKVPATEFEEHIAQPTFKSSYLVAWAPSYPSLYDLLAPLYGSAAADGRDWNYGDYKSKEFDAKLAESARADSNDTRIDALREAEEILLRDLPAVPLYYLNVYAVGSKDLKNIDFNWRGSLEYRLITK